MNKMNEQKIIDYEQVDMHSKGLTDVASIFESIARNPKIKRINFSDNYITKLPKDLSYLTEIEELNLIDNELDPFENAVLSLINMPKLDSLHLNLHEADQVDFVIRKLPNLRILNGEPIDREDFNNESTCNEPFEDNSQSKTHDHINQIKEEDQEDDSELPSSYVEKTKNEDLKEDHPIKELERINSSFAAESQDASSDTEEISLRPQDLESIALIFDKIRNMHRKNKMSNDKEMANEFDRHLKT